MGPYDLVRLVLDLDDSTGAALASDALPASVDLADFDDRLFFLQFDYLSLSAFVRGEVTSLSFVPEPCVGLLLGAAALLLRRSALTRARHGR